MVWKFAFRNYFKSMMSILSGLLRWMHSNKFTIKLLQRISWFVYSIIRLAKPHAFKIWKKNNADHIDSDQFTHTCLNSTPRSNFRNATARLQFREKLLFSFIQRILTCLFSLQTEKNLTVKINSFRWWDLWKIINSPLESESFEFLNVFV